MVFEYTEEKNDHDHLISLSRLSGYQWKFFRLVCVGGLGALARAKITEHLFTYSWHEVRLECILLYRFV